MANLSFFLYRLQKAAHLISYVDVCLDLMQFLELSSVGLFERYKYFSWGKKFG